MADTSPSSSSLIIEIKCPRCARPLHQVNSRSYRGEFVALAKCKFKGCAFEWAIRLIIAPAHRKEDSLEASKCGTSAGYQNHRRKSQEPCENCIMAHRRMNTQGDYETRQKVEAK